MVSYLKFINKIKKNKIKIQQQSLLNINGIKFFFSKVDFIAFSPHKAGCLIIPRKNKII